MHKFYKAFHYQDDQTQKKMANFFASVPFPEHAVPSIAITGNLFL